MRSLLLLFVVALAMLAQPGYSQEEGSWKINIGKKTVFTAANEDTVINILQVKKSELGNNGVFKIEFTEKNKDAHKGWVRTMVLVDSAENMMVQRDSAATITLYNKDLLKLIWARKKLKAFTWSAPADPGMAAAIRIRRTHLCTLVLVD